MAHMGSGLTPQQELKVENSRQLTNVALVLLPAIGVVAGLILQFRNVGNVFWWIAGGAAISCAVSIYLGGLAISRLRRAKPSRFSLFNGQAVFVVIGFALLLSTYFSTGEEKVNEVQKQLGAISKDIGQLSGRLETLEENVSSITAGLKRLDSKFIGSETEFKASLHRLADQLSDIKKQVDKIQPAVNHEASPSNE